MYTKFGRNNAMNLLEYPMNFTRIYQCFRTNYNPSVTQRKKAQFYTDYILVLFDLFLFLNKKIKVKSPVCVVCGTIITIKHILIERADLVKVRKKYFEKRFLYSLFRKF